MRTPEAYQLVYSETFSLDVWPVIAFLVRAAENAIARSQKARRSASGQQLSKWRGPLAYVVAARITGTCAFKHQDVVAMDLTKVTDVFMDECWATISQAAGGPGSMKISETQMMKIANAMESKWSVLGHPADGKRDLPSPAPMVRPAEHLNRPDGEVFLKSVSDALPPQPWKPGVHIKIAEALGIKPQRVTKAIRTLIARGVWLQQRDGIVFDRDGQEVARDISRVTEA